NGRPIKLHISNPTEEQLKFAGYKEIVEDEVPTYDEETQYIEEVFTETENEIHKSYVVKNINVEITNDIYIEENKEIE
ncbi:MAG: hypothetical protein IJD90_04565, partial [Clostridia bacterium]|nr:hypothetical protein [Clostridia bacterium]